jgi:CRISPR-associated protein Cmr1
MFGGGVHPGNPDPVSTVRVPSIRGHLRFWWRVTRGWGIDDPKELARRETSIWGSTEEPSKVQAKVAVVSKGIPEPCAEQELGRAFAKPRHGFPGYALFPFHGNPGKNLPIGKGQAGVEFDLILSFPKSLEKEITGALWAWCNFGGLGARTRRGAGALYCSEFAPKGSSEEHINRWLREAEERIPGVPLEKTGIGKILRGGAELEVPKCWEKIVGLLWNFRQKGPGRNPGDGKTPGRSLWPEPETIRKFTGKRLPRHARMTDIPDSGFPRAEFGLPIIFHFKDAADPGDTTLVPCIGGLKTQRMASPLILKPLAVSAGLAVPLVLRLRTKKPLEGVELLEGVSPKFKGPVEKTVVSGEFAAYKRSPMGAPGGSSPPRSPKGSALEAFLSYAVENGFREVKA